jgi:hypothetical protein
MSSFSSFPRKWTATRINSAPITIVNSGPRVVLRCEVALITACSTGLVATRMKLKRAGSGAHPES